MSKLRLGIIGCGGYVCNHVRDICEGTAPFQIAALCDTNPDAIERLRERTGLPGRPKRYGDHKTMLAEAKLDAVIVTSPHTLHYPHCRDALKAGCHVLVEKPMVTNSSDARRLVALAEKVGKDLQIGIQGTYTDTFAYARKLISDGTMGPLQLVTGQLAQSWMRGTSGSWRQNPKLSGGGQLYDSTAHVISAMMFLVNAPVREVFCLADNCGTPVDINAVVCCRFANGCMATITSGGNCPTWKSPLTLQGANAIMEISAHGGQFRVSSNSMKRPITKVPRKWDLPTVRPVENFADVILGAAEPRCPAYLGVLLSDLMDAIYASVRSGKLVRLP